MNIKEQILSKLLEASINIETNPTETAALIAEVGRIVESLNLNGDIDWIPCTEKLPNTDEWRKGVVGRLYLVTYREDEVSKPVVGMKYFKISGKFESHESVIAWAEVPKPFSREEEKA